LPEFEFYLLTFISAVAPKAMTSFSSRQIKTHFFRLKHNYRLIW
jgi:hypothetical protein